MFRKKTKILLSMGGLEDIEDMQGIPQSISSLTPSAGITLHIGRGMDAKHDSKSMDNGKFRFRLQSFASFSAVHR